MEEEIAAGFMTRLDGPFSLRFFLQPTMAILFAIKDGMKDARTGQEHYLWSLLFRPGQRRERIAGAWASIGKVTVMAVALDSLFQWMVMGEIKLTVSLLMAAFLCVLPYSLLRGPVSRLAERRER